MLKTSFRLLLALLLLGATPLLAHESRPLYLQVEELPAATGSYRYHLQLKIPPSVEAANTPFLRLPEHCRRDGPGAQALALCSQPLTGQTLIVDYPRFNPSIATLIRVSLASGERHQTLLAPGETHWQLPAQRTSGDLMGKYAYLGVVHILEGWDHLLFLLCLLLIAGTLKRTLVTVSGFTLAHSLTLALTTLGLLRIPIPPVEAVIALSILFLAAEISRDRRDTLAWRHPVVVSLLFGLIHGFGFASVLGEVGLPQREIGTALLFFNLGVELGQLLFVALVMALFAGLRRWRAFPLARAQQLLIYGVGSLAAFWTLQRIAGF
ncbi:HupE/UreJ family protein [Aestuariirhabdus litorea]|uniref:HupE/UreJ family protein n=1 Tax=Aestuariirhabdus litorea TaxID=2528527 RepID=A0A3P3VP62_9GAMM|nr:HupE/UreJ family protein [Aestuariirhabdus litorea]RRJ84400.1 HupE/UreJ family protein [Aestuariirhabdus litorea]RWW97624.1 HupE/UreJ family protein [Endozoicomonadaceae bacterium GTF-13]